MNSYRVGLIKNDSAFPSFKADTVQNQEQKIQTAPIEPDKVDLSAEAKAVNSTQDGMKSEKKGPVRGFKNFVGSVKKFFVSVGEYAKGTAKGLFYGGLSACAILGADSIRMNLAKANKPLSGKGKIAAGAVALAVMGYQLFKASLNASEKKADVDHRWGTGHNQK